MKSFEPVHGMSRVVKLVPDNLATAIAIYREHLENPDDDGFFMIDLVKNLLSFFCDQITARQQPEAKEESQESGTEFVTLKSGIEIQVSSTGWDFRLALSILSSELEIMKASLRGPPIEIVVMPDDILTCCYSHMDCVHMVWLDVQRKVEAIEKSKNKSERKKLTIYAWAPPPPLEIQNHSILRKSKKNLAFFGTNSLIFDHISTFLPTNKF